MESLVVTGPPPEALESVASTAEVVDPVATPKPRPEGRVLVALTPALVESGWLATDGWTELATSAADALLVVQIGTTPCALVPEDTALVHESDLVEALAAWRDGRSVETVRPPSASYPPTAMAPAWETLAVRVDRGEDWLEAAADLGLPSDPLGPGAYFEQRFRLLATDDPTALFTRWTALDTLTGRRCTLHVLHAHEASAGPVLHEATQRWAAIDHPAVAAMLGFGELEDGRTWYASEAPGQGTFEEKITSGSLSPEARQVILLDVLSGLDALHEADVVHGGLDPNRVLLSHRGSAKITDVGLVGLGPHAFADGRFTAPERLDPESTLEIPNDVYGLAALTLQVLHGERLPYWVARDPGRLLASQEVTVALGDVLRDAFSWVPERRPGVKAVRSAVLSDARTTEQITRHALTIGREDLAQDLLAHLEEHGAEAAPLEDLKLALARRRASRGDPVEAIATLTELAQDASGPAPIWLEIAELQQRHGIDGALASWESALDTHQTREEASAALRGLTGNDSDRFLRWGRALALYAEGAEHAELSHRLGNAFHAAGDEPAALLWLDRAASEGLDDPELLALREQIRAARGEWSDVVDLMVRQAEQGIGDPVEQLTKAARIARRATPDPEPVANLFRKLLEVAPDHAEAHRHLARHASRSNDTATALTHYETLTATAAATAADHCGHARLLLAEGHHAEARASAGRALALEPSHEVALRVARRAAQECGAFEQAAAHQDRLVELNASTDGGGHAGRLVRAGDLHRFAGALDTATDRYDEAIAFTPNHLGAWWGVYVIERSLSSEGPPAPLCFGPEEALARLFAEILERETALEALKGDGFGSALGRHAEEAPTWQVCAAIVDTLSYHEAIGPDLFDRLLDAFPERSERIVSVRNLWSGSAHHTASFPVAECMLWADDGPDFDPALHRELVYRAGWPRESGLLQELLDRLMQRSTPLPELPELTDPGDDEDLLLEAPEIPMLVIGEGERATQHAIESGQELGPDEAPMLPGPLALHMHGDRLYVAVSEGLLEREGQRSREFRLHGGDQLTWDGVRIRFYRVQDRDALGPVEPTESGAEVAVAAPVEPIPLDDLGDRSAFVFERGDQQFAVPLDAPETAVIEQFDGSLVFSRQVPEHYLAVVLYRHGHHYIEQELTNASGFGGRLSARSMENDEVVMIGSTAFRYRSSSPSGPALTMPEPSLSPRPMLLLRDGSLLGQPVPLTEGLFRIGRGRACELQIRTDALLSRVHCRIHGEDGQWVLEDAGSSNGTRVNGTTVRERHPLTEGDVIEIGHTEIDFTHGRSTQPPAEEEVAQEVDALFEDDPIESDTQLVDPAELDEARKRAALSAPWTEEQAEEKIRVANRAFRVLFSALDDAHGQGKGAAQLQLLIAARPKAHNGLLDTLELEEAVLPLEPVMMALEDKPESERRQLLTSMLLSLIDSATEVVCDQLTEDRVEVVLSRMAHLGHRRSLQL